MKSVCSLSIFVLVLLFVSLQGKIRHHDQSKVEATATGIDGTYKFTCAAGYVLKGRKDWTDQQTEGTQFLGFTCCPENYPDLLYLNENYFCCPAGTGGYCMSNSCNCQSGGALKGGKYPTIEKLA